MHPPGLENLYVDALQQYMAVLMRVKRGETKWGALTKTEQLEVDEVRRLLREAADQGHAQSQWSLINMFCQGIAVKQDYTEANMWYRKA